MAKSDPFVGRNGERQVIEEMIRSNEAEFLALYGRRRVGKTRLIRSTMAPLSGVFFNVTGQKDASLQQQLTNFQIELERTFFDKSRLPKIQSWREGLEVLADAVETAAKKANKPITLFFDELPWLATPRSGLIQALDYYWNQRFSRLPYLKLVVCGSAASWILEKLIHAKGGLHNRITRRIRLEPFTLKETNEFLRARKIPQKVDGLVRLYLSMGGIPHYLKQIRRGYSAAENIALHCFQRSGVLHDEFSHLFAALFKQSDTHERIIRALATKRRGLTRNEILSESNLSSGGGFARALWELEEAGFVSGLPAYKARKKNTLFRLVDEYCWFYLSWIERSPRAVLTNQEAAFSYWLGKANSPAYRSWAAYAFESICLKHAFEIKTALGISNIPAEIGTWRYIPRQQSTARQGAQVDLLFDREDGVINLCEIKYSQEPFKLTKNHFRELSEKLSIFEEITGTKKQVVLTLVTLVGLEETIWSKELVDRTVEISDLL